VFEGVETEEQLNYLKEQGVEYIQGFYFSKPIPYDELIVFLKEHNI
jgi:sensor c-di-GMP phosphodiesterase-like protein